MARVEINYGPKAGPIIDQLKEQGHTIEDVDVYEALREAILRLAYAHTLTEAMATKAFQRLHNNVMRFSKPITK